MESSLGPLSGGAMALGGGGMAYGIQQGRVTRRIAEEAAREVDAILRPTVQDLAAVSDKALVELDAALDTARVPVNRLVDHTLDSDIGGPLKLLDYVKRSRELGRVARTEINTQIDVARASVLANSTAARELALQATIDSRQVALEAMTNMRGPAMRASAGLYVGLGVFAAGMGAGLVALSKAIDE